MNKLYKKIIFSVFLLSVLGCQTISTKVDETTKKESKELSKWIGKTESDLTSTLGKPDRIDFGNTRSRYYVYVSRKLKIICERKFEINQKNMILGFSSKNCF